jgi:hypothetical protein
MRKRPQGLFSFISVSFFYFIIVHATATDIGVRLVITQAMAEKASYYLGINLSMNIKIFQLKQLIPNQIQSSQLLK